MFPPQGVVLSYEVKDYKKMLHLEAVLCMEVVLLSEGPSLYSYTALSVPCSMKWQN